MSEYPDPDEEYELMYADELELIQESETRTEPVNNIRKNLNSVRRSLDFTKDITDVTDLTENQIVNNSVSVETTPVITPIVNYSVRTSSNKRTAEELFGDICDIDFDDVIPNKKQKTEEEVDMELINKILENRKNNHQRNKPVSSCGQQTGAVYDPKENLSYNIPRWAFVPLTNSEGERLYIRLESDENWNADIDNITNTSSAFISLNEVWGEARKILEKKQQKTVQELPSVQTEDIEMLSTDSKTEDSMLWVDRYKPHSYIDLLSEEPVNRELLHWLHLWDKVVFKREVKTKEPQQRNSFSKRTGQFQLNNKWKGKKADLEPEVDEDGRPHYKIALLCGPPGAGKTTLAHLLARLAGYRPFEINASDERSVDAFRTAIQSATLMQSVLDADKRPNCLILDEVDGAPLPTIELLVRWCTSTGKDGGKKKTRTQPLRRPIIAICNDLYANSLRPLRAVALLVHVGPVSQRRLASRLGRVAEREGLIAPPHVLSALASRSQGDIRAALAVLHFIKMRARQVRLEDVMNVNIGEKDCTKGVMQALQAIFTVNDNVDSFKTVLNTVTAAGEYVRLADGIFENYLNIRSDVRLLAASETINWLRLHDMINTWTMRTQNYSLYSFLPVILARCHCLLATRAPIKMRYPVQAPEMARRQVELESILWTVARGSAVGSIPTSKHTLLLDVVSLLPYLLSPKLRSVNLQLCSDAERKELYKAASVMCDYGLQYIQRRGPDGFYTYVLEPDIFKLAFISGEEKVRIPPAIRQALASEVQLEQLRRAEEYSGRVSSKESSEITKTANKEVEIIKKMDSPAELPNHMQRLTPRTVDCKPVKPQRDFFGRVIQKPATSQITDGGDNSSANDLISSSGVFYQYREGFNNAVRRSVRMRDLL